MGQERMLTFIDVRWIFQITLKYALMDSFSSSVFETQIPIRTKGLH